MRALDAIAFSIAGVAFGCRSVPERPIDAATLNQVSVNGTIIRYVEQGRGEPVVFVHGAISDHRYWEYQRDAVSKHYRFIALDRRYFGTTPWPDTGVQISQARDADDLAAFIRVLEIGPALMVGTSGGANVVLITAARHPEAVRAVLVQEPGLRSILTDSLDRRIVAEGEKRREAARAAARAGDMTEAARLFIDFARGQPGSFDRLPPTLKAMFVDNARVLSLSAAPEVAITCGELARIRVPVTITKGQVTQPRSRTLADGAHRCIPQSQLVTIPNAGHGAPTENPSAFNDVLLAFLAKHSKSAAKAAFPPAPQ